MVQIVLLQLLSIEDEAFSIVAVTSQENAIKNEPSVFFEEMFLFKKKNWNK